MSVIVSIFEVECNTRRHRSAEIDRAACDILMLTYRLDWVCFYCKILPSFLRGSVIWCLDIWIVSFNLVRFSSIDVLWNIFQVYLYLPQVLYWRDCLYCCQIYYYSLRLMWVMHYITVMQTEGTQHMAIRVVGLCSVIYIVSNIKKTLCEICTMQTSSCCVAPLKHVLAGQVSKWSILDSASILHSFICVQIYIVAFTTFWIRRIWFERIVLVVEVPDYVQISVVGILIKLIGTSSTLYYYYIFWGRLASIREFHPAY